MARSISDWTLADAKIVTPDEFRLILAKCRKLAVKDPYWNMIHDIISVGVNTGLRVSEILHIEKFDVLPTRLMMIRRKKLALNPKPIEVKPDTHRILRRCADNVTEGFVFPGNQGPCFIHHEGRRGEELGTEQVCVGGHVSIRNVQRRWRILLEAVGLYKYGRGIHTARHTAITQIYDLTKNLRTAQEFAGHSSSRMTEHYAHITTMRETVVAAPVIQ